jgi:hypothetical protein
MDCDIESSTTALPPPAPLPIQTCSPRGLAGVLQSTSVVAGFDLVGAESLGKLRLVSRVSSQRS